MDNKLGSMYLMIDCIPIFRYLDCKVVSFEYIYKHIVTKKIKRIIVHDHRHNI